MVTSLDNAQHSSADPPDDENIIYIQNVPSRGRGRRKIDIDVNILEYTMELWSNTALGELFGCSPRTIHRRALENGIVNPSLPVRSEHTNEDGSLTTQYTSFTPTMANITDQELDHMLGDILQTFPSFGCQMLIAQFRLYGYRVSRRRVCDSYIRVVGPPPQFGGRWVERWVYKVAGPNALCHHDGWHGASQS
jgi:hypothetical protein